jgi:hypothetical protein
MRKQHDDWPEDVFSFSGSDKPAPQNGKGYQWKDNVEDWNWMDFFHYFEDKYTEKTGLSHWYNMKQKNAKKGVIEQSFKFWGKEFFRAMIDWLFDNYKDYPQWNDLHIGLVCGAHGWAKMIGEKTKKQIELDKRWKG